MKANLFIKYRGTSANNSEIDLVSLGESILGFDSVIKDIVKISNINADLRLNICGTREGSLIIDINTIVFLVNTIPFEKIPDLLSFLKSVDHHLWQDASAFFNPALDLAKQTHRTINDYFAKNPFDQEVFSNLVTMFVGFIIGKAQSQKHCPNYDELPKEYANKVHGMIKAHKFKKILKPLIEEKISSIDVSADSEFKVKAEINLSNFENYLSDDEKILPEYENGKTYTFQGKIVAMQCSRGDSIKLKVEGFSPRDRELIAYPIEGQKTKDLEGLYEEDVVVKAMVARNSLYQKPKLYIQEINLRQLPLLTIGLQEK